MRRIPRLIVTLYAALCAPIASAYAAEEPQQPAEQPTDKPSYIITVGGFGALEPRFEGARRSRWGYQPLFDIRKEGDREWLNLPRDGFDFSLYETDTFRAGLVGDGRWERDVNSIRRGFRRVSSVDLSIETGVFAEMWPSDYLRTRLEIREAVLGANGLVADASADFVVRPLPQLTWTAGPRLSVADSGFMRSNYAVSPQQALASGLTPYVPSAGVRSYGAGSMLKHKLTDNVSTMAFWEYQRLADPAYASPLIWKRGTPNQTTIGLGLSYAFTVGK